MIVCMSNFECFSVTVPTLFILNLDYFLCDIRYCCTRVKTRNTATAEWIHILPRAPRSFLSPLLLRRLRLTCLCLFLIHLACEDNRFSLAPRH